MKHENINKNHEFYRAASAVTRLIIKDPDLSEIISQGFEGAATSKDPIEGALTRGAATFRKRLVADLSRKRQTKNPGE